MSQPVKLSDALVLDARLAAEAQERSIASQVEFWAKLGRTLELLLDGGRVLSLCRGIGATPLADLVDVVDTSQGREMFRKFLASEPFPHYEAHPTKEGLLVRTEEDGARTVGRFVNRAFIADPDQKQKTSARRKSAVSRTGDSGPSRPSRQPSRSGTSSPHRDRSGSAR